MIINLKSFKDLGKCSMGTMLDEYDTEKNHIYYQVKAVQNFSEFNDAFAEVKINNAKDLTRWLWCNASIATGNKEGERQWFFCSSEEWWISENKGSIAERDRKYAEMMRKLEKLPADSKSAIRIQKNLPFYDTTSTKKYMVDLDERKAEIVKLIIEENN